MDFLRYQLLAIARAYEMTAAQDRRRRISWAFGEREAQALLFDEAR